MNKIFANRSYTMSSPHQCRADDEGDPNRQQECQQSDGDISFLNLVVHLQRRCQKFKQPVCREEQDEAKSSTDEDIDRAIMIALDHTKDVGETDNLPTCRQGDGDISFLNLAPVAVWRRHLEDGKTDDNHQSRHRIEAERFQHDGKRNRTHSPTPLTSVRRP